MILVGTWGLLRDSVDLALDAVPRGIDPAEVAGFLAAQPGVSEVHDLHIWAMSTTETALTVHLVRPAAALDDGLLARLRHELHERFAIAPRDHPGRDRRPVPAGAGARGLAQSLSDADL